MKHLELHIPSEGGSLRNGVVIPDEPRAAVLLLHGIPSVAPPAPGDRGYPYLAETLAARGWVTAWIDMRAVRGSPGYFSISGWVDDAEAAIDALRGCGEMGGLPLGVVGFSAGGAVAATAARRGASIDALAVMGSPATWVSFAGSPAEALVRITEQAGMAVSPAVMSDPSEWAAEFEDVSTATSVKGLEIPILVVHSDDDDVVPVGHAERIARAAPHAKVELLVGAGHQLRHSPEAIGLVTSWLDRVL